MSRKTVQTAPSLVTSPVEVFSFVAMMAISRWLIVASVADRKENAMFWLL
jgi:hypothetical protein